MPQCKVMKICWSANSNLNFKIKHLTYIKCQCTELYFPTPCALIHTSIMPSHYECRQKVCLLCMRKGSEMRQISTNTWMIIEEFVIDGLDRNDERLPTVLCNSCRKVTSDYGRGIFTREIDLFDHSLLGPVPARTRSSTSCSCLVCATAASIPHNIAQHTGAAALPERRKPGRPSTITQSSPASSCFTHSHSSSGKPSAIKLCSLCFTLLARGYPHHCTKTARVQNLQDMAHCGSPRTKEKVANHTQGSCSYISPSGLL